MAELIRTITEQAQFEKILYKFFLNNETFLKTKNGDIKTKFLGSTGSTLALKIPFIKNMYESCVVFTRYESYTIYAWLKFAEKQEEDVYTFTPVKFQFISAARREDRRVLDLGERGRGSSTRRISCLISSCRTASRWRARRRNTSRRRCVSAWKSSSPW